MNQYTDTASPTTSRLAARFHWHAAIHSLLVFAIAVGLMAIPSASQAAPTANTWYVKPAGNDASGCLSLNTACKTIKVALSKASPGDTIIIESGVYQENLGIFINLTLQGADQATTIVDGNLVGTVLSVSEGVTANLSGLTIRNGRSVYGAGIKTEALAVINISNSTLSGNVGLSGGGGILNQGRLKLTNVTLSNNVNLGHDRGGGLLNLGSAELIDSVVSDNRSLSSEGGGIGNRGVLTITSSTLSGNQAGSGGAIYNENRLILNAALISRNQANSNAGGGIYNSSFGVGFNPGTVIDSGSLITGNVAATSGGGVHSTPTGNLIFNGTRIMSNTASTFGGGLYSDGITSLTSVSVKDNRALYGSGGGLYSANISSTLTINLSQIIDNQSAANGGGLLNSGTAFLSGVSLLNNRAGNGSGGGIYNAAGQFTLAQSDLNGNAAAIGNGGGLFNAALANLTQVAIQNNQSASGGGLYNDVAGELLVAASTVYKNNSVQSSGGGINNRGALTLTHSTLYSNTTTLQGGSGLYNNARARLINVTFSYNTVLSSTTGAILNDNGTLNVLNSTISHNAAPALALTGGSIALANTIVAASAGGDNCNTAVTSDGYNLTSDTSCGLNAAGDINNPDPLLGPLSNNGGSTLTRSLQPNSPALDAGQDARCPGDDQRGVARPQGDHCDIGAYEIIGFNKIITQTVDSQTCISSTQVISSGYLIGSLHVGANVAFTPRKDLRVKLYAPHNLVIQLLGATLGSGQNLDVLWDDDSTLGPVGGAEDHTVSFPYYKNVRVPDQNLAPLFGRSLRGTWQLEICNVSSVPTNTAMLNRWSLIVPSFESPKVFLPLIRR